MPQNINVLIWIGNLTLNPNSTFFSTRYVNSEKQMADVLTSVFSHTFAMDRP